MLLCVDISKCLIRAGKQLIHHHHLKCHFHSREKTLTTLYRDGILATFRLQYEEDYEYEFSVLSTRFRFEGQKCSKCACWELKTRTSSRPRTPIWRSPILFDRLFFPLGRVERYARKSWLLLSAKYITYWFRNSSLSSLAISSSAVLMTPLDATEANERFYDTNPFEF